MRHRSNLTIEARVDAVLACNRIAGHLHEGGMHDAATSAWVLVAMLRNAHFDRVRAPELLGKILAVPVSPAWRLAALRAQVAIAKEALGLPSDEISAPALAADRAEEREAFPKYVASLKPGLQVAIEIPVGVRS